METTARTTVRLHERKRRALLAAVAVAATAALGCKEKPPAHCTPAHADKLHQTRDSLCKAGAGPPHEALELPWPAPQTMLSEPPEALAIEASGRRVWMGGESFGKRELEEAWRERMRDAAKRAGPATPQAPRWAFAVAPTVEAAVVADALHVFSEQGSRDGYFIFRQALPSVPPPPNRERYERLVAELKDEEPGARAADLARRFEAQIPAKCDAFELPFVNATNVPAEDRCSALAEALPAAMIECQCGNEEALMDLLYVLMVQEHRSVWVPVRLSDDAEPVTFSLDETWAQLIARTAPERFGRLKLRSTK